MGKREHLSPSTRNLIQLIRKHLGQLKTVKAVYLSRKDVKTVVWVVGGQPDPRTVRALKAQEAKVAALRPDLQLDFRLEWRLWLKDSEFLKYLTAAGAKRIYQRR